ncbi:hypothetical protein [Plantactinospora sonchi]|uniref:Uncharacterized protein n=1 Tax=Plantactinospora sonchi TaxID=1544735 RepID=A0ABU7RUD9_9ACTN
MGAGVVGELPLADARLDGLATVVLGKLTSGLIFSPLSFPSALLFAALLGFAARDQEIGPLLDVGEDLAELPVQGLVGAVGLGVVAAAPRRVHFLDRLL